jgi:hypothetical protein
VIDRRDEDNDIEYDDDSDADDRPDYVDDIDYDEDEGDTVNNSDLSDQDADESADHDNGYNSNETDIPVAKGCDRCCAVGVDESGKPVRQNCDTAELDGYRKEIRQYKALCYEDICSWIIRNPEKGERDILAIEVHLRHYKGVDNKPKPCVPFNRTSYPG